MTEQELKDKIELYRQYLREGNKSPGGTDQYITMIEALQIELQSLQND